MYELPTAAVDHVPACDLHAIPCANVCQPSAKPRRTAGRLRRLEKLRRRMSATGRMPRVRPRWPTNSQLDLRGRGTTTSHSTQAGKAGRAFPKSGARGTAEPDNAV